MNLTYDSHIIGLFIKGQVRNCTPTFSSANKKFQRFITDSVLRLEPETVLACLRSRILSIKISFWKNQKVTNFFLSYKFSIGISVWLMGISFRENTRPWENRLSRIHWKRSKLIFSTPTHCNSLNSWIFFYYRSNFKFLFSKYFFFCLFRCLYIC